MKILLMGFILFFSTLASAVSLNKMVVFGDSLSDNGNLYEYMKHQLPVSPPYFEGRFTNGPVWVEILTQYYYPGATAAHLFDYAYGGAGVMEDGDDDGVFTLRTEMDTYFLANHDKADDDSLYIIWIGSNNYLAVPDDLDKSIQEVSLGLFHALQRLAEKGAKHVLVVTVPDLGLTPAARDYDAVERMTYLSLQHNQILKDNLTSLKQQYPQVEWYYFDVNWLLDDIISEPARFGFINTTNTCYEALVSSPSSRTILNIAANLRPKLHDACEGYLFFDPVHPGALAHEMMAERVKTLLEARGVDFK
jgi:phospholipase/lecithinase/hemolysin